MGPFHTSAPSTARPSGGDGRTRRDVRHINSTIRLRYLWDINEPKADRFDGWIVRPNSTSNAPATSVTLWTVCIDKPAAS
jgi:hypothetical protein